MRIGIYLTGLNPSYVGGLTTYAVGLLNGLLGDDRGHEIVAFVSSAARQVLADRIRFAPEALFADVHEPAVGLVERLTLLPGLDTFHERARDWRMRGIAKQISANCDVILFPLCFMTTYRPDVPSIVSFHDLQHEVFPQFFNWRSLRARRVLFGATFRHATLIQASSTAMKDDALRIFGDRLKPERVAVIPEGVDYAMFSGPPHEDARKHYGLPDEFILYPAQLWHHKNHVRLLEAMDLVWHRESLKIPLVLNGAEYEAAPAIRGIIRDRGLADRVFLLGKVPLQSLLSLYRQARYVVSASLHESNCLPILEAAASGSPIIVSDIAPNRESAQIFQLRLFDPFDIESIAATLSEAWRHRHANEKAIDANRESARRFDWSAIASMYIDQAEMLINVQRF